MKIKPINGANRGPSVNSKSAENAPHLRHPKPKQSSPMMHI